MGVTTVDLDRIISFIKRQKVAFIASVDDNGVPAIKAMLSPRKITDNTVFYFSTNTSSLRVKQYQQNPGASIYFYHKGLFRYRGVMLQGTMDVLEDAAIKEELWHIGDTIFYKQGVTDPDYCVLRFTAQSGRYYCNLNTQSFSFPS